MEQLLQLYRDYAGCDAVSCKPLSGSGSNRKYYRLRDQSGNTVVGAACPCLRCWQPAVTDCAICRPTWATSLFSRLWRADVPLTAAIISMSASF